VVNGVAVMVDTLGKAIGPIGTSYLFALTLSRWGRSGHSAVFLGLGLLHAAFAIAASRLPAAVEGRTPGAAVVPSEDPDEEPAKPRGKQAVEAMEAGPAAGDPTSLAEEVVELKAAAGTGR